VFVSGTIGDATLGLMVRKGKDWKLTEQQRQHLASRYLLPQPRNALAEAVRTHASAAMDVSDGLVGDFSKLCRASGVAAEIQMSRIPLSDAAKAVVAADPAALESALTGGDDYEIVCTSRRLKPRAFVRRQRRPRFRLPRSVRSGPARAHDFWRATAARLRSSERPSVIFERRRARRARL
jgi:thiamine monophosphate kinase